MNGTDINSTLYFVSQKQYEYSKFVIYLICIPVIATCGIVGNTFSLYILQKYPTKHAFVIYLKTLTATDTCLLCMSLLQSILKMCVSMNVKNARKFEMYGTFYAGIILGSLLQRLSSGFITVIAIERFLAVKFPLKLRRMPIETRPCRILVGVVFFFVLLQIPTLIVVEVEEASVGNDTMYMISRTNMANQRPVLTAVYLFSLAGFGIAVPLIFVLISTCCIVVRIGSKSKTIARAKVCKGSFETESMTWTLVALASMFTVMSLPGLLIYIWTAFDRSEETMYLRALCVDVNIALICINSGCDFIIYCMTSKKFRVLFFENVVCNSGNIHPSIESLERLHEIESVSKSTELAETSSDIN